MALLHYSILWGPPEDLSLVPQAALLLAGAAIAAPDSVLGGAATADACAEEAGASDEVLAAAASCGLQNTGLFPALLQAQPKAQKIWKQTDAGIDEREGTEMRRALKGEVCRGLFRVGNVIASEEVDVLHSSLLP